MHHDLALKQMPHWDENRIGVSWIKAKACKLWIKWTIVRRLTNRALFRVDKAALAGKMSTIGKWTRNDIVPCAPNLPKAILEKEWDKPRTNDKKKRYERIRSWHEYEGIISGWFRSLMSPDGAWFQIATRRPNEYDFVCRRLPALEYFRALASANFVAFATSHCRGHARS